MAKPLNEQVAETLFTDGYTSIIIAWVDEAGDVHFFTDAPRSSAVGLACMLKKHTMERAFKSPEDNDDES